MCELLEDSGIEHATHLMLEDVDKTARSAVNNSPIYSKDGYETFFMPYPNCKYWDCPICTPVDTFAAKYIAAAKEKIFLQFFFYVGAKLDGDEAKMRDLKQAKEVVDTLGLMSESLLIISDLAATDDDDDSSSASNAEVKE